MEEVHPTSTDVGMRVVKVSAFPSYDVELARLEQETLVWIDALKGPVKQLVGDAGKPKQRDNSMLAIQQATDAYNAALKRLVDEVYKR